MTGINEEGKVGLANLALRKIGANRISSFNDETREGDLVRDVYQPVLEEVITTFPWSFALTVVALTQKDITPLSSIDGLTIAYAWPNDCLRPHRISQQAAFRVKMISGERVILSDAANLQMEYVFRNDNPETYFPIFKTAFATRLAAEIGFNISHATKKAALLREEYDKDLLPEAKSADSMQGSPDEVRQDEWEVSRISGAIIAIPGAATWHSVW